MVIRGLQDAKEHLSSPANTTPWLEGNEAGAAHHIAMGCADPGGGSRCAGPPDSGSGGTGAVQSGVPHTQHSALLVNHALMPACLSLSAVGWVQLRKYEQQLHALQEQSGGLQGSDSGPVSSSAACTAKLEAAGVLPDRQGRLAGHAVDGADAAGAAARSVKLLTARRRLYDAMEASLLRDGLILGGCCGNGSPFKKDFPRGVLTAHGARVLPLIGAAVGAPACRMQLPKRAPALLSVTCDAPSCSPCRLDYHSRPGAGGHVQAG